MTTLFELPVRSSVSPSPPPVSRVPATLMVVMIVAGELEVRVRDVTRTIDGSVDIAIMAEMVAYLAVAGVFFLGAVAPRGRRLPVGMAALWGLVAVLALSGLWAPSKPLAIVRAGQLLVAAGFATTLARRADRRDLAALAHVYVLLVSALIGLGLLWRVPPNDQVARRFNWAFTHPVAVSSLLVVSVVILIAWTRSDAGPRFLPAWAVWTLLAVHTGALLATQTRGAIFAAALGFLVWTWLAVRRRRDLVLITVLLLPILVVAGSGAFSSLLLRGESTEQLRTLNSRVDLWTEAWREISETPLIGRGYFSAREIFLDTIGLGGAHNTYIEIAVSAGLLGCAALLWALYRGVTTLREAGPHPQRALVGGLFAALLANGLTAQFWAQGGTGTSLWFMLVYAWAAVMVRETRAAREERILHR